MYASSSCASSSSTITKASVPDGMPEKIRNILERFEEISKHREALLLREEDGTRQFTRPKIRQPTSSHVDEIAVFGRQDEKKTIINLLNPSIGPNFMVLPIVGMGGLGKTTLAQLIYNDSKICESFDKRVWVSVSEDFDLARMTRAIIESISKKPCAFSELTKLQDILKETISDTSLFLVLDDVWNENKNLWEGFRVVFSGAKIVRILTTTRNSSVAEVMQTSSSCFNLGCLPEEKCWSLFYQFAIEGREDIIPENLLKIGHDIVKKCKGLPLAIKALGGILRYEMDEEKWIEVLKSNTSDSSEILPALWLSYRKMPLHLRPCFLYLSIFPKGKFFVKDEVIMLWRAQGYIVARPNKTFDELGNEYFNELQCRSLVNVWLDHKYVLHDLIHDLARKIYERESQPNLENDQSWSSSFKIHHLYLTKGDDLSDLLAPNDCRAIRTLINYSPDSYAICCSVFSEISCLRTLKLMLWHFELPNIIGTLKHLRYLSIVGGELKRLPESICHLYNLQSLDLDCWDIPMLPENIKNLINLRYLRLCSREIKQLPESICLLSCLDTLTLKFCNKLSKLPRGIERLTNLCILKLICCPIIELPSGIGKLTNLRTLSGHFNVVGDGMMAGLGELKDMNKLSGLLCISGLKNIVDLEYSRMTNLASKPNLHELILNFEEDHRVVKRRDQALCLTVGSSETAKSENDENIQEGVLEYLQPHNNIMALKIFHYRGRRFPSWLLYPYRISNQPPRVSFGSLEVLVFTDMPNLVEWVAHDGHFPCLKILTISKCPKLWKVTIPQEVKLLQIKGCGCEIIKFSSKSKIQLILISDCRELFSIHYQNGDLPALRSIKLSGCPNLLMFSAILEESKKQGTRDSGFQEIEFSSESKIEDYYKFDYREHILDIFTDGYSLYPGRASLSDCPKLRLFSAFPVILDVLWVYNCGFREVMFPLGCKELRISNCLGLTSVHCYDGGLSRYFHEIVKIVDCPHLELLQISKQVKELKIISCGIHEIILPSQSNIASIHISCCPKLISVHFLEDLPFLKLFSIISCPQFHEVLTIPSQLRELQIIGCNFPEIHLLPQSELCKLIITACSKLISVKGLQLQCFLRNLQISRCPVLQFPMDGVLHPMTEVVHIYDCPKMDFGNQQKSYYYQVMDLHLNKHTDTHIIYGHLINIT